MVSKSFGFLGLVVCFCIATAAEDAKQSKSVQQLPSPPAQKRFLDAFKGKDKGKGGGGGGWSSGGEHEGAPGMAGGFGMYPLWKFHKFDGFSLRPVPMQLDIGHGIPAPPPSVMPDYPSPSGGQSYGGSSGYPSSSSSGGYQSTPSYTPPAASAPSYPSSYSSAPTYPTSPSYSPAPSYPSTQTYPAAPAYAGGQQYQSGGYQQSNYQTPITMGYQPSGPPTYSSPPQSYGASQPSYSQQQSYAPATPPQAYGGSQQGYGQQSSQQSYGPPAQTASYPAQEMTYSASNNQPTVSGNGFGPSQVPSYAAYEGGNSFGGVSDLSMPMDSNKGVGYIARHYDIEGETPNGQQNQQPSVNSEGSDKNAKQ